MDDNDLPELTPEREAILADLLDQLMNDIQQVHKHTALIHSLEDRVDPDVVERLLKPWLN